MNCVGIDVSKGKSMIVVMRPLGKIIIRPFEVGHACIYTLYTIRLEVSVIPMDHRQTSNTKVNFNSVFI